MLNHLAKLFEVFDIAMVAGVNCLLVQLIAWAIRKQTSFEPSAYDAVPETCLADIALRFLTLMEDVFHDGRET